MPADALPSARAMRGSTRAGLCGCRGSGQGGEPAPECSQAWWHPSRPHLALSPLWQPRPGGLPRRARHGHISPGVPGVRRSLPPINAARRRRRETRVCDAPARRPPGCACCRPTCAIASRAEQPRVPRGRPTAAHPAPNVATPSSNSPRRANLGCVVPASEEGTADR